MTISIDWKNKVIFIPKEDTTLVQVAPNEVRNLDLNWFRSQLKSLEDSAEGICYPDTHSNNSPVELGGVIYARSIQIINDYVILFEDGQYAVRLLGANSNIEDRAIVNQVSVRSSNSAGLVVVSTESGGTGSVDEGTIHSALNSYPNKSAYKADITNLTTTVQLNVVNTNILDKVSQLSDNIEIIAASVEDIEIPSLETIVTSVWNHTKANQISSDVSFIRNIEGGKWEIKNNQMIFYAENNTTELARFNLYNEAGVLAEESVFKRVRV